MTEAEEKLLWGWSQGDYQAETHQVRQAIVSALDEVHRLRGEAPPRIAPQRAGKAEAPMVATLRIAPDETAPYWKGRAEALEGEVCRLIELVRLLARDPD